MSDISHNFPRQRSTPGILHSPFMENVRNIANKRILRIGATLLVAGGVVKTAESLGGSNPANERARASAIAGIDTVSTGKIIIKSGANLRATPEVINPDQTSNDSNIVGTVRKGEEISVAEPLEDSTNTGWDGFVIQEQGLNPAKGVATPDRTVWADTQDLTKQGLVEDATIGDPLLLNAHIGKDGSISISHLDGTNAIDTMAGIGIVGPASSK